MQINRMTLLTHDLETAKDFYMRAFGFACLLDETRPDGKRLIVVAPESSDAGFLLAEPKPGDADLVGRQSGQRVMVFIDTHDLSTDLARFRAHPVVITDGPRTESFGTCVIVRDLSGNLWEWVERTAAV